MPDREERTGRCGDPHCPVPMDHGPHSPAGEITELRSRLREVEAELEKANEALRECTRLSGADLSDGFPIWPSLPDFAVQEVKQLRADYDECPTPEDLQEAREALKPFAALAAEVDDLRHSDDSTCPHRLNAGDIRRVRGVLRKGDTDAG